MELEIDSVLLTLSPSTRNLALTFPPFFFGLSPFSSFCFSRYKLSTVVFIFLMFVDVTVWMNREIG